MYPVPPMESDGCLHHAYLKFLRLHLFHCPADHARSILPPVLMGKITSIPGEKDG